MKIAISSDSVLDLSQEQIKEHNIKVYPLTITLGDDTYSDGVDITPKMIFEYVTANKVLPKTSATNEFTYTEIFEELKKEYDAIIHFTISSEMSCCYQNAVNASKNFENVYVIDSKELSTGIGLEVLYACALRDKGISAEEIVEKVKARIPHVQASFVVDRLDYLHKGGRCSALAMFGANLLKLRPQIIVKEGKMGSYKKYRGKMKDVVYDYIKDTLAEFNNPDHTMCFITYSSATEDMLESAKKAVEEYGKFETVYYTTAGATVTSHCGENTLGILYFNDGTQEWK